MSIRAQARLHRSPRFLLSDSSLSRGLCAGLLFAGAVHVDVGISHLPTLFGVGSLVIGVVQSVAAVLATRRQDVWLWRATVVACITLVQLFAINTTLGLPPLIAHTHQPGTHAVFGMAFAYPNPLEPQGLVAQLAQALAIVCAWRLLARYAASTRRSMPA